MTMNKDLPLTARLAVAAPTGNLEGGAMIEFQVMPAGKHTCWFGQGNTSTQRTIIVDRGTAVTLDNQLKAVNARSKQKAYFDFDHDDKAASAWPTEYHWRDTPEPGVYCQAEVTDAGAAAIKGKTHRAFSPVFHADRNDPAKVICRTDADLNFGGLVNDPAFKQISPLWAKNAAGAQSSSQNTIDMTPEQLAALQASIKTLEQEMAALKAKSASDAAAASALTAKESEHALKSAQLETEQLRAKNTELTGAITAHNTKLATDTIQAAVARGAIPAKDEALQAKYRGLIESDPSNIVLLASLPGNAALEAGRVSGSSRIAVQEGPKNVLKAFSALHAKQAKILGVDPVAFQQRSEIALEMGALFGKEIHDKRDVLDMPLSAADTTDTNLGTLTGTLVAQRTLQLFKYGFPVLNSIATDFSDQPASFNQTIMTRIIGVPAITSYDPTTGWGTVTGTPTTTDVSLTLDEHIGVPLRFGANLLAGTVRRIFDEVAPAASYSLGKYFVDKIYKLLTLAKFNAYKTISATVPISYPSFAVAQGDISRTKLTAVAAAMNQNLVPIADRFVLLNSPYYAQLASDPSLTTFFAGQQQPGIITDNELPKLATFRPIEAPNLPSTANLVGFASQKNGLVAATRLPNDYTQALPGSGYGSVSTITNPDTGISVVLTQYVDHKVGFAEWRISVMLGAAVGDNRAGLCLTSQ